mgnify:CR=1 FL=1
MGTFKTCDYKYKDLNFNIVVDFQKIIVCRVIFYIHLYSRCVGESLCSRKLSFIILLYNPRFRYWHLFGKLQPCDF